MTHAGASGPWAARILTLPDGVIRYEVPEADVTSLAVSVGSTSGATSIRSLVLDVGIVDIWSSYHVAFRTP
jgi:hypothetical protein